MRYGLVFFSLSLALMARVAHHLSCSSPKRLRGLSLLPWLAGPAVKTVGPGTVLSKGAASFLGLINMWPNRSCSPLSSPPSLGRRAKYEETVRGCEGKQWRSPRTRARLGWSCLPHLTLQGSENHISPFSQKMIICECSYMCFQAKLHIRLRSGFKKN